MPAGCIPTGIFFYGQTIIGNWTSSSVIQRYMQEGYVNTASCQVKVSDCSIRRWEHCWKSSSPEVSRGEKYLLNLAWLDLINPLSDTAEYLTDRRRLLCLSFYKRER